MLRCGCGTFHLNLGAMTLHLNEDELVLLAHTIHRTVERHPHVMARIMNDLPPTERPQEARE